MRRAFASAALLAILASAAPAALPGPGLALADSPPPACSLPTLSAAKLERGEAMVRAYRRNLRIEFSPRLQGYAGLKLPPFKTLSRREQALYQRAGFFRLTVGLNTDPRLIFGLQRARRHGARHVGSVFGVPVTKPERQIVTLTFKVFAAFGRVDLYGKACAPGYAGLYVESGQPKQGILLAARFKNDLAFHTNAIGAHFQFSGLLAVEGAQFDLAELSGAMAALNRDRELLERKGIAILIKSVDYELNRVAVLFRARDPARAARVFDRRYGDVVEPFSLIGRSGRERLREYRSERRAERLRQRVAKELGY